MEEDKILTPKIGTVVLYKNNKGKKYPVFIESGFYLDPDYGRLSNHWRWRQVLDDGTLGPIKNGYGNFFKAPNYRVEIRIHFDG